MDFNAGFTAAAAGLASHDHNRKTRTCSNTGTGKEPLLHWPLGRILNNEVRSPAHAQPKAPDVV
jgi:hypothetical protein